ncbi:MAG: hypothetical protein QM482_10810, partial [Sulfurospirillum sp.]
MKKRNNILLSCVVASLVLSSGYAGCPGDVVIINDVNTTGVALTCTQNLNVTTSGSIKVFSDTNDTAAVNSDSNGSIINSGLITTDSSGQGGYAGGIMQHTNANNITNNGIIETNSTGGSRSVGIGQMFDATFDSTGDKILISLGENYTNEGNITNHGTIKVDSNTSLAVGIIEVYGNVENSGVIEANSSTYVAVGVWNLHGNIENSGTVNVDSSGYVSAGIDGWDGNITNSGTIVAKAENGYGVGIFSYNENDSNVTISNSGTITATMAIQVEVYGDGASSQIQNQGTINTSAIYARGSTLVNSGTINLHMGS